MTQKVPAEAPAQNRPRREPADKPPATHLHERPSLHPRFSRYLPWGPRACGWRIIEPGPVASPRPLRRGGRRALQAPWARTGADTG